MPQSPVPSPLQGTIVSIDVQAGDEVHPGAPLLVMESMKMELSITAPVAGEVTAVEVATGDRVREGQTVAVVE